MTVKIDGTNTVANPAFTGADTDTGLQCGTNELKLVTGGSARATVDSSGNVGVGGSAAPTSSVYDTATLHLRQAGSLGSQLRMTTATSGHTTADGAHISFWNDNNLYVYNKEAAGHIVFGAGDATQGRFTADGLCFNNDTAAANALDDYEEGTYTPTITLSSGSATLNTSYDKLAYTKIGRVVHVQGQIVIGSVSSPGGTTRLTLPFTSAVLSDRAGYSHQTILSYYNGSGAPSSGIYINRATIDHNMGSFAIRAHTSTSGGEVINTGSYLASGSDFWVNLTYIAV